MKNGQNTRDAASDKEKAAEEELADICRHIRAARLSSSSHGKQAKHKAHGRR